MIIKLGPITLMDSKTRSAYRTLSNKAYALNQAMWYTDDWSTPSAREGMMLLRADMADAISRVPASDIDSLE